VLSLISFLAIELNRLSVAAGLTLSVQSQVLINALTGQVESWHGTCPVTRLIGTWRGDLPLSQPIWRVVPAKIHLPLGAAGVYGNRHASRGCHLIATLQDSSEWAR
jgi:hypothetical protein